MKGKMKKILTVILTAAIGVTALVGCGSKVDEGQIENIIKARDGLLAVDNLSLTYDVTTEVGEESQTYVNEIVVNNETTEWYGTIGNVMGGETVIFNESLTLTDGMYIRFEGSNKWETDLNNMQVIYGLDNISNIKLDPKDYEGLKESKEGKNTIISIKASKDGIKKFKEEMVKEMERVMEEYKNSPNVIPESIAGNMANLEALKQTNYKAIEYTFNIDKAGILVGYDTYFEIEQPEVVPNKDGQFEVSDNIFEVKMTSTIRVNSYNNEKNVEIIEGFKAEIEK